MVETERDWVITVKSRAVRWVAPAAVVVAVGAGVGIDSALSASASPSLPARSVEQLMTDMAGAQVTGFSGTVVQHADLGIPSLPDSMGGSGSGLTSLISGSHTMRVWYAGPDKARMALLGTLDETDVIRNGDQVWEWSSSTNTATRYVIPADLIGHDTSAPAAVLDTTPSELAQDILGEVDPTTKVAVDDTTTVAGRNAYQLRIEPRDATSLIGHIEIAVDASEHVPLRVQVFAKGADKPAIDVGFSHVSFTAPPAQQFEFNPPPGATVAQGKVGTSDGASSSSAPETAEQPTGAVVGHGWTSIAVLDGIQPPAKSGSGELGQVLSNLPRVSGSWGSGRLFSSALVTALFTDDGRLLIGAVPAEQLYAAAGQ
jgi:outer membrane lipoprotein-sorting protein